MTKDWEKLNRKLKSWIMERERGETKKCINIQHAYKPNTSFWGSFLHNFHPIFLLSFLLYSFMFKHMFVE
jgi:hypothetical protein